jgi:DNA-directed RNA polymerase
MFQEFTGKQNLAIDVAGSYGLDKLSWQARLDWFHANEAELLKGLAQAEEDGPGPYRHELFVTSKKPSMQFVGMLAWRDMLEGRPSGYGISLDATASGLQLLSCLAGCRKSASLCNVLDTGERENAYSIVFQAMLEEMGTEIEVDSDTVKKAVKA